MMDEAQSQSERLGEEEREREKRDERETARDEKRGRPSEREIVCVMAGHHSIKLMSEWCPGGREDGWDPEQE